ncbi:zinc finger BED domain-containing protein 5 [Nephila pilipes]|uniref:Zinc finger BED domain-containing protein 5 n=1 Tax=Nephila pilipes TaxID=299642 RepID=A0A8X6TDR2_NEPPI|nr:zinc finger BED domain-containing protein 5 [Nephila pilipes]
MSNFCEKEFLRRLKDSEHRFTIQLDETTDISELSILLVIVRYIHGTAGQEDMLIYQNLPTRTTAEEIVNVANSYIKKHDISWDLCHLVCTYGAKTVLGKLNGVVVRMKQKNPYMRSTHNCLHIQALAVKKMSEELKKVLNDCVGGINFIKSRLLNSRLFNLLRGSMGSLHKTLLFHTDVRWLSHGKVLTRFCELKDEIIIFFSKHALLSLN